MCNYQRKQIEAYFSQALDLSNDDILSGVIEDMAAMVRQDKVFELGWMAETMDLFYKDSPEAVKLCLDTVQYYLTVYATSNFN